MFLGIIARSYDEVKTTKQDHAEDRMTHEFRQGLKGSLYPVRRRGWRGDSVGLERRREAFTL